MTLTDKFTPQTCEIGSETLTSLYMISIQSYSEAKRKPFSEKLKSTDQGTYNYVWKYQCGCNGKKRNILSILKIK